MPIDFLTIGHVTHDLTPDGFHLGGTVSFAAVTARRLGWHPGILTRASADGLLNGSLLAAPGAAIAPADGPLAGIPVHLQLSQVSTTFTNIYCDGQRTQVITARAEPLLPAELPLGWRKVPVVLLGPVVDEVAPTWTELFPRSLLGVTPQGWMRGWDSAGHVTPRRWDNAASILARADVAILSREDAGGDEATIADLACMARMLVVTDGWHGAVIYVRGDSYRVTPRPTTEVDPTGAGDVFAAAFLLRLAETEDPLVAARFANVVASMSVEAIGMAGIPPRDRVDAWLEHNR